MKKYLVIKTYNGEGYSDSTASVEELTNHKTTAKSLAEFCSGPEGFLLTERYDFKDDLVDIFYTTDENQNDCGRIVIMPFRYEIIGVSIDPLVNEYEVISSRNRWNQLIDLAKTSENYEEEEGIYNTCHHGVNEDGGDLILINLQEEGKEVEEVGEPLIFPNGFDSWQKTHFEIVTCLTFQFESYGRVQLAGTGGLYEQARRLTDKFEKEHELRERDGDLFNTLEKFLSQNQP